MQTKYRLPVSLHQITSLGCNPLREEWKHKDLGGSANYLNYAWDFIVPRGTTVVAAREGKIINVKVSADLEATREQLDAIYKNPDDPELYQLAVKLFRANNRIIIEHPDGTYSLYAHLQKNGSKVKVGEMVKTGQPIGYSGNVGFSYEPHLHFEIYKPHSDIDPVLAYDGENGGGSNKRESIDPRFNQKEVDYLQKLVEEISDD